MTKEEIRKIVLEARRNVIERRKKDSEILLRLTETQIYKQAKTIMTYISYNNEVDTLFLIDQMIKDGKTLCAPKCIDAHTIEARKFGSRSELKAGAYGILEPTGDVVTHIDLILVPGVAFNERCHRIGYGAGYYDRFLEKNKAITCGLFYEVQRADFLEEKTDIGLDYIITEKRVYEKGR